MDIFDNYKIINQIHSDNHYHIYRAIRQSDRTSVLIKVINNQFSNLEAIVWLENEYKILQTLSLSRIIKPYSLEKYDNSFILVLEDFEGEYLERFLARQQLSRNVFFSIAIQILNIVQQLHSHQIIHQ